MSGSTSRRRLALFDLDGTLLVGAPSERRFARQLARAGLIGPRQALSWLAFVASRGTRRAAHVLKRNKAYLHGLSTRRVAREAERLVAGMLDAGAFDAAALEVLAAHRRDGDRTVLLSGTPQAIADAVAERLGLDTAVGTLAPVRGDRYGFGDPIRHPFGAEKRALAETLAASAGIGRERVVAYGDSIHDRELLDWAGTAVAVAPDRHLARVAGERHWIVLPHGRRTVIAPAPGR